MKKKIFNISIFVLVFVSIFTINNFIFPNTVLAQEGEVRPLFREVGEFVGAALSGAASFAADFLLAPFGWLAILILQLANLFLWLAGSILNLVVDFAVINMATNMEKANTINIAWKAFRDIANMGFIFILLYAAIQTILGMGSGTKKVVVNVIVVALLINFSLFFTKIVIDTSNVFAVFFYDGIQQGVGAEDNIGGIAGAIMNPLKLTTLMDTEEIGAFDGKKLIIIGLFGSIFVMIAAFIFFAMAIMLVVRFVALMFVLVLSPIAFISFVLPALKDVGEKWKAALIGQAFFAPIFFLLIWVVLLVSKGLFGDMVDQGSFAEAFVGKEVVVDGNERIIPGEIGIIMNFIIMIVLLISSLVISKQWSNKAGSGVASLNKWASGAAGGVVFGGAAFGARQTVGRGMAALADSETLKEKARAGSQGARLALWAGRKGGATNFDARSMGGLGGAIDAGSPKTKKGYEGFVGLRKAQGEKAAKVAESYAPSEKAKAKAKERHEEATLKFGTNSAEAIAAKQKKDQIFGNKEEIKQSIDKAENEKQQRIKNLKESGELKTAETKEKAAFDTVSKLESEVKSATGEVNNAKIQQLSVAKENLKQAKIEAESARRNIQEQTKFIEESHEKWKKALKETEIKPANETGKEKYAQRMEKSWVAKLGGYNYEAAAKIRKGKTINEQAAELVKKMQEEKEDKETSKPQTNDDGGGRKT